MKFLPAACPTCSGQLQLPNDQDNVKCMYCGNNVIVQKAIQAHAGGNIQNYLRIANTASGAGNHIEAYNYYTKVLEYDPSNLDAWVGKASSAGWMSTLADFRMPEMISGFDNAIGFAPPEKKQNVRTDASIRVSAVASTIYNSAQNHLMQFVTVPNAWPEYLSRCDALLRALQQAHHYDPANRQSIEGIIHICATNIQGIKFKDQYQGGKYVGRIHAVSPDLEIRLRQLVEQYAAYMRNFDPNYRLPIIKKAGSGNCAIATATMGDYDHPDVKILRTFRDRVLLQKSAGRAFVKIYYRLGPLAAVPLRKSPTLRSLSKMFLIRPAALLLASYRIEVFSAEKTK